MDTQKISCPTLQENQMKEVKAFIHPHRISSVIDALRGSGFCDMNTNVGCYHLTTSMVQRLHTTQEQGQQHYSVQLGEPVVDEIKLEFICEDDLAEQLIGLVKEAGKPSPGWIFMGDIQTPVKIA